MMINFAIRVVDVNGNGVKDAQVSVQYPWADDSGCTDEDGWVRFEREFVFGNAIPTAIYVNGEIKDERVWIEDENTFSYQA